ncbi:MAG: methyltransferase family protein, partial [Candidatus Thorarchaeota archaeon]
IRHPAYLGVLLIVVSFCALRFSLYSFTLFIILYICFRIHIHVEEGELLQRFGEGYKEYMSKVPGLYITPRNLGTYFRFLRGRD